VRLLIYSDLHLDANSFNPVLPDGSRVDANADLMILAGDIDEGTRGIRWARETFPDKGILYIAGNQEFYTGHWIRTLDELREAAGKFDVDFLECDGIDIGGIRFLGTSLWTDFHLFGADRESGAMKIARASMMDYHEIQVTRTPENLSYLSRGKYLSPELTAKRHEGSISWLEGNPCE
jgi:predicted phosphodiesterase